MTKRPHERLDINTPPKVDPKYRREEVGRGAEQLREEVPRPIPRPNPATMSHDGFTGAVSLPGPPRFGDRNHGLSQIREDMKVWAVGQPDPNRQAQSNKPSQDQHQDREPPQQERER